jgi:hypothetical protein
MPQAITGGAQALNGGSTLASAPVQTATDLKIATMQNLADLLGQDLAATGYKKFAGGLIVQWGLANGGAVASQVITFPIPFPSTVGGISLTHNGTGSNYYACSAVTTTQFSSLRTGTADNSVRWIAIGF